MATSVGPGDILLQASWDTEAVTVQLSNLRMDESPPAQAQPCLHQQAVASATLLLSPQLQQAGDTWSKCVEGLASRLGMVCINDSGEISKNASTGGISCGLTEDRCQVAAAAGTPASLQPLRGQDLPLTPAVAAPEKSASWPPFIVSQQPAATGGAATSPADAAASPADAAASPADAVPPPADAAASATDAAAAPADAVPPPADAAASPAHAATSPADAAAPPADAVPPPADAAASPADAAASPADAAASPANAATAPPLSSLPVESWPGGNSNSSRPGTAARFTKSSSGDCVNLLDTSADKLVYGNGIGTRSITDSPGSAACAPTACVGINGSNSSIAIDPPAVTVRSSNSSSGSGSSCLMLDLDASAADTAWQPGMPISRLEATATDAQVDVVNQMAASATKFKLDVYELSDLCKRVPDVRPECAAQIYKSCLQDVDAVVAACNLGVGGVILKGGTAAAAAAAGSDALGDDCCIEFDSLLGFSGGVSGGARLPAAALTTIDGLHKQANDALATANQLGRAVADCFLYSNRKELEQSEAAARSRAVALRADAHAAAYTAHNCTLNVWHTDLCGLDAAEAVSTFASQLGHIASLEYPGGSLLCVVTGPACNNTIEETVSLEQQLLAYIVERGGVPSEDPYGGISRAGRVGNVVVAFLRVEPSSQVVDASCQSEADAAAKQAGIHQAACDVYTVVAKKHRAQCNIQDAAKWQSEADKESKAARAAHLRSRALKYAAHNSSVRNCWRIDLHGQSEATAVSKVVQQLQVLTAMGHPGAITLRIITGKGKHSTNQVAKIRPAVLKFLRGVPGEVQCELGRPYTLRVQDRDGSNDGVVLVHILPAAVGGGSVGSSAAAAAGRA